MIILYLNIQLFKIIDYVFFQLLQIFRDIYQRNPLFLAFFFEKIVEIRENT